ncbi:UNVERIFIED_CONTAM: hypothetical protein FKN15_048593 [Acipenser sinensis]
MAVTRRGLPLKNVKGVRKLWRKEKLRERKSQNKDNKLETIVLAGKTLGRPHKKTSTAAVSMIALTLICAGSPPFMPSGAGITASQALQAALV